MLNESSVFKNLFFRIVETNRISRDNDLRRNILKTVRETETYLEPSRTSMRLKAVISLKQLKVVPNFRKKNSIVENEKYHQKLSHF